MEQEEQSYQERSYPDLYIKSSYDTFQDDLLNDFYIPVLEHAKRYDRISGFFSSTALAVAARGIVGLIRNGGKMRLLTCQKLSREDARAIQDYVKEIPDLVGQKAIESLNGLEESFKRDHVAALGYMLKHNILEMKIAVLYDADDEDRKTGSLKNAILHQKVGLLYDADFHGISFSGSNNESATGWLENIEEFKTFKSWLPGQKEYFEQDRNRFEMLWNLEERNHSGMVVMDLPAAVKNKLLKIAKDFRLDSISMQAYLQQTHPTIAVRENTPKKQELSLYYYQKCAVNQWIQNNHQLMLQMATGTGKTRTAFACIQQACREIKERLLIVIATPQTTLTRQWINDMNKLDLDIDAYTECSGEIVNWRETLKKSLLRVYIGQYKHFVVFTTHATASSQDFIAMVRKYSKEIFEFFIGDEVHGMGAVKTRDALLPEYTYRLGLSATPKRWFDEEGSALLEQYFGNQEFYFGLHDALTTINPRTGRAFLVNYRYYPCFISLTDDELEAYKKISQKISKLSHSKDKELQEARQRLLTKRAEIGKNAQNKYQKLEEILTELGPDIRDTLIFVSPQQIDKVMQILKEHDIIAHRVTQEQSQKKSEKYGGLSEREYIIKQFAKGNYQAIVAMKCMDEGIDIPSARCGIIMASSTNPREYVQRIGRIIRQNGYKSMAMLYDMVIGPQKQIFQDDEYRKMEQQIYEKEMKRIEDLSEEALNNTDVLLDVYQHK